MKRLSSLLAPAVAGVVREKNVRSAIAEIRNCQYNGADMIDLHITFLENYDTDSLRKIISSTSLPVLALNYDQNHMLQSIGQTEEERTESLLRAVEAGAAGIDIQGYTFHTPSKTGYWGDKDYSFTQGNPREIVTDPAIIEKQCTLIEQVHSMGAEVLLSCHPNIPMNCQQVVELAQFLAQRNPDIIKIVTKANTQEDAVEAIRTMLELKRQIKIPVSYHASGQAGSKTRIVNPLLGGQIAFCVDRYNENATMEQLHLPTVRAIVDNTRKIY